MIYTITTCTQPLLTKSERGVEIIDRDFRAVGYYFNIEEAMITILENRGDLQERRYEYAVLEAIPEGIYPISDHKRETWFQWNNDTNRFEKCEKPSDLEGTFGFSFG